MLVSRSRRARIGFTLVELLIVLVIIAALAALVIPRLGFVQDQAGNATSANTIAGLVSNLEAYKTSAKSYPLGMDTLVDDNGAIYDKLWKHSAGPAFFGIGADLEVGQLSELASFGHSFLSDSAGNVYFYDHDSALTSDFSNSGTIVRNMAFDGSDNLAFVKATATSLIKRAGYPTGTLPAGVRLVAFGVGPNTGSIGDTMVSAPQHSEQDNEHYGRYIALFAVHSNGKSANLKTVVDSFGSSVDSNISSYNQSGPDHE